MPSYPFLFSDECHFFASTEGVAPFRAYALAKKNGSAMEAKSLVICADLDIDTPTLINSISGDENIEIVNSAYTIDGKMLSPSMLNSAPKGMYIVNGKKVVK